MCGRSSVPGPIRCRRRSSGAATASQPVRRPAFRSLVKGRVRMRHVKISIAVALVTGVALAATVIAQSGGQPAAKANPLSAMDYIQIKQLANRFAFAYDTAADSGCEFADLFTADGEFQPDQVKGRDKLAALARLGEHGPFRTGLYMMNHLIEPSPEGARGKQY